MAGKPSTKLQNIMPGVMAMAPATMTRQATSKKPRDSMSFLSECTLAGNTQVGLPAYGMIAIRLASLCSAVPFDLGQSRTGQD
jgi:hypothetical protein